MRDCSLVVTCTPAAHIVLNELPRDDAFVVAVGAFTPTMVELSVDLCRHFDTHGRIFVDTRDADHEAGDLLHADLSVSQYKHLGQVLNPAQTNLAESAGPILLKSCGWAGWDLAAARCAMRPL